MKIPVERRSINSLKRAVDWLISAAREMISRYDLSKPSVAPTHTRVAGLEAAETAP